MGRTPTIRDVALRAGVSVATASNVVNGVRPVGEASRRKVLEAIAALDYRLDRAASALRGRSTRLIGMVVPDITNVFFASLVHGVEGLAERDGYEAVQLAFGLTKEKHLSKAELGHLKKADAPPMRTVVEFRDEAGELHDDGHVAGPVKASDIQTGHRPVRHHGER